MKTYLKQLIKQLVPILLSALIAGGISFLQSLLAQTHGVPAPLITPEATGALGAGIKTIHTAWDKASSIFTV